MLSIASREAQAQCVQTGPKPPLCRNDYALDLYQGPVLAPLRVTAMGGAYAAIADGVEGLGQNAAAATVRPAYSLSWFDYDLSLGAYLPGAFGDTDFDNRGEAGLNSFTFFYTMGAVVQLGPWGVGVIGDFQRYTLTPKQGSDLPASSIQIARTHASTAYSFFGDQLSIGGGLRGVWATIDVVQPGSSATAILPKTTNVLSMINVSPEIGMLIRPDYTPWRLGATYRFPVDASGKPSGATTDADGLRRAAGLLLPQSVHLPWEVEVGVALSAGPRPLNPKWINPHEQEEALRNEIHDQRRARERARDVELSGIRDPEARERRRLELERDETYVRDDEDRQLARLSKQLEDERRARYLNWPRARIQVTAEALVTGSTASGIGVQSFLRQEDVASGTHVSVQPRLGLEGEPVPTVLVTRVGTYVEPSRYVAPPAPGLLAGSRQHFTFGLDVHTFAWDVFGLVIPTEWRVSIAGDVAPRYHNLGLGIGTWH